MQTDQEVLKHKVDSSMATKPRFHPSSRKGATFQSTRTQKLFHPAGAVGKHTSTVVYVPDADIDHGRTATAFPHFVSVMENGKQSQQLRHLPSDLSSLPSLKSDMESGVLRWNPLPPSDSKTTTVSASDRPPADVIRLQQRYVSLVETPEVFNKEVQFLQYVIRQQQLEHRRLPHMRDLRGQQLELDKLGGKALIHVKPVLYAAFCMQLPRHVFVNAAMRVGAANHFLMLLGKTRRKLAHSPLGCHRHPYSWIQEVDLNNVCVYPLEVLPTKLRLFRLVAPQRIDQWARVFECALK